ncbi:MAG: tetratricopeptide repeat protein [Planctomycetota bacterium]
MSRQQNRQTPCKMGLEAAGTLKPSKPASLVALLAIVAMSLGLSGCSIFRPVSPRNDISVSEARQWTRGGMDALDKGRFDTAQEFFVRANEQNPGDERVLRGLAEAYAGQGRYEPAIGSLQQIVATSNDPSARVRLGEIYLANGQWFPARQEAERALEADRKLAAAWVLLGRTELVKGAYHSALENYHRAMSCDPDLHELQLEIAAVYQRLNQPERALSMIEQFVSRYPEESVPEAAEIARGQALLDMGQHATAIGVFADATRRPDATSESWVRLGQAQMLAGQESEARTTLARASQMFPDAANLDSIIVQLRSGAPRIALSQSDNPEFSE